MINNVLIPDATDHTPVNGLCSQCNVEGPHNVLHSYTQKIDHDMDSVITDYQIVLCQSCKSPSFRKQVVNTDLYYFDEEKQESVLCCFVRTFS
ncbi:hypothetical protein D3C77_255050 [compost metagenome]